jgi:quinolinate synthase
VYTRLSRNGACRSCEHDADFRTPSGSSPPRRQAAQALTADEEASYRAAIAAELKAQDAVLVAHFYCDPVIQALAEETGGCVSDSLEMARFGAPTRPRPWWSPVCVHGRDRQNPHPGKTHPDADPGSDLLARPGLPGGGVFGVLRSAPERTVVVYANTSAAVKARADWVVTSSCALEIVESLMDNGETIIWGPDKHLGTTFSARPVPTCCCGTVPASSTKSSSPSSWKT